MITLEMIAELVKHPNRKYKSKKFGAVAISAIGSIMLRFNNSLTWHIISMSNATLSQDDWEICNPVPKEVDFLTAITSMKRIKPLCRSHYYTDVYVYPSEWLSRLSAYHHDNRMLLINDKWLIQEEDDG